MNRNLKDTTAKCFHYQTHDQPRGRPAGTCAIGREDDDRAVVDARCRLHGLSGLYVADASVIAVLPSANTNLPTMMVAEHVAHWLSAQG